MENYKNVLRKYMDLEGRSGRKEYWMFILFSFILTILAIIADFFSQIKITPELGLFSTLFNLIIFMPGTALIVRRLHDVNQSGWWIIASIVITFLSYIIPHSPFESVVIQNILLNLQVIISVIILIFTLCKSSPESNKYGPNPKSIQPADTITI